MGELGDLGARQRLGRRRDKLEDELKVMGAQGFLTDAGPRGDRSVDGAAIVPLSC
jgi:hypothetical protein